MRTPICTLLSALASIFTSVASLIRLCDDPVSKIEIAVVRLDPVQFLSEVSMLFLLDNENAVATVKAVSASGNPAPLPPGLIQWSIADPNVVSVTPSPDGLTAVIKALGPVGTTVLTVTAGNLSATATVTVTNGPATALVIEFGQPQPNVPPTPEPPVE